MGNHENGCLEPNPARFNTDILNVCPGAYIQKAYQSLYNQENTESSKDSSLYSGKTASSCTVGNLEKSPICDIPE